MKFLRKAPRIGTVRLRNRVTILPMTVIDSFGNKETRWLEFTRYTEVYCGYYQGWKFKGFQE